MPLTACRECGREVSTEAATCPHCGAAAPTRERTTKWVPCPKCGSAQTARTRTALILGSMSLAGVGCAIWIPVIGFVLVPLLLAIAAVSWIVAIIAALTPSRRVSFFCQACKRRFSVPKSELAART